MRYRSNPLLALPLALAVASCGSDDDNNNNNNNSNGVAAGSDQGAVTAFGAANAAFSRALIAHLQGNTGLRTQQAASAINVSNASCQGGGTISGTGTFTASPLTANVSLTLNGCTELGVALDGSLSAVIAGSFSNFEFSMNGSLTLSGEVQGSCTFSVSGSANSDNQVTLTGTVCGVDVNKVGITYTAPSLG